MKAFTRSDEEIYIPIYLAIVVKENEERVLVGSDFDISDSIQGGSGDLYFDKTRQLGSFLLDFPEYFERRWVQVIVDLRHIIEESKKSQLQKQKKREDNCCATLSEREADALKFLKSKYETNNPVIMYYSLSVWKEYLIKLMCDVQTEEEINQLGSEFYARCIMLVQPLYDRDEETIKVGKELTEKSGIYGRNKHEAPSYNRVVVEYPKDADEYAMGLWTIHGLKNYYAEKMKSSKKYIAQCVNCQKIFITKNIRQKLCCEECKKKNARKKQALYRKRETYHELEMLSNRENRYWDTRIAKLERIQAGALIEEGKRLREQFRTEQKQKKKKYKTGMMTLDELSGWYDQQEKIIKKHMDKLKK